MAWQDRDYNRPRRPDPDGSGDYADHRQAPGDEDDEADGDDPEAPDESDQDDHDEPDLLPCPHCRQMITEDAEQCPHCGEYLEDGTVGTKRPTWIWIGIALAVLGAIWWAIRG
jgi:predicted nucleic acid-binding Zn ribbon protein